MFSNQPKQYFSNIDYISEWLYEQSGIYVTKIVIGGTGSYLDPQQKKSYIVYDHGDFVVVNYFDHKTQESISKRFNKNGTHTDIKIKRQPSRPHKPSASSKHHSRKRKQCYYDIRQFHNWLITSNRAWHYLKRKGYLKWIGTGKNAFRQLLSKMGLWDTYINIRLYGLKKK